MKANTRRRFYNTAFRILFTLAVLAAAPVLTACSQKESAQNSVRDAGAETDASAPSAGSGMIVGFSQIGAESAWRMRNSESMQEAAQAAGVQLLYHNAEQKQENQIKAIRSFIVYQVDVIVFVPIVQHGWENVLNEAREAGIPVIVADRKLKLDDPSLVAGFIGPDHFEEGRQAARFLLAKYTGHPGPLQIFELRGTDGSSVCEDRAAGFRDVLAEDSRFHIVYSETGDFLRSKGREVVENFLTASGGFEFAGRPVDILFSHNDGMTLGALEVLENAGLCPGKDITVVSVDAEQAAINALRAGKINCVVECNPNLGPDVLALAERLVHGESISYFNSTPERTFSEFDDLRSIQPRGY